MTFRRSEFGPTFEINLAPDSATRSTQKKERVAFDIKAIDLYFVVHFAQTAFGRNSDRSHRTLTFLSESPDAVKVG